MDKSEKLAAFQERIQARFAPMGVDSVLAQGELTIEISRDHVLELCVALRDEAIFRFECLMDVTGVDYSDYGISEWQTEHATHTGFSRGVMREAALHSTWSKPRFAVVYHLLSQIHNQRLRIRTFAECDPPSVPSVTSVWASANWYEREAFDLFGILFEGHPDLRRILTDYGFVGHPFRKDFPLIGTVEMRFDAKQNRVVYEPVSIQPRVGVPKVIRQDNRYCG